MPARTLFEKIWDAHLVSEVPGESALLYIDLHLVHEVTSPQAFEGVELFLGDGVGDRLREWPRGRVVIHRGNCQVGAAHPTAGQT